MIIRDIDDPVTQKEILAYLPLGVNSRDVVLDLGANVGAFARHCVKDLEAAVVAVEADALNFQSLVANVPGARFVWAAVTRWPGFVALYKGKYNTTHSTRAFSPLVRDEAVEVPSVTLPNLLRKYAPTIIKCDIEGAEWELDWHDLAGVRGVAIEFHDWDGTIGGHSSISMVLESQGFKPVSDRKWTVRGGVFTEVWLR